MFYDKSVINEVKKIDALTYLMNFEPDNVVKISRNTYCTKEHDSLKLSNGMWYWFSKSKGGKSAIDYLMIVKGLSFKESVKILLEKKKCEIKDYSVNDYKNISAQFIKPEENYNNNKVIKYLLSRGIDIKLIIECIDKKLIYEDKYHNAVFAGYNLKGEMKYAFIRGTNHSRFMKEAYGSIKAYSFKIDAVEESRSLHLFESAIDLLSYASLNKDYYKDNLLSLAGVYKPATNSSESKLPIALKLYFYIHPEIEKIYFHLDNDRAGREATYALMNLLKDKYKVIDEPPKYGKDFNDFLCHLKEKELKKMNRYER